MKISINLYLKSVILKLISLVQEVIYCIEIFKELGV